MKTPTPEGLIGSMYELHGTRFGASGVWIVVAAWNGDGRGRRGRKGVWRVTLAPLIDAGNKPMFNALWNDVGKHLEGWDDGGNWMLTRQLK